MKYSFNKAILISTIIFSGMGSNDVLAFESECSETATSGLAMAQCSNFESKKSEDKIDQLYKSYLLKIAKEDPGVKGLKNIERLKQSQASWKIFKDLNCDFVGAQQGGSSTWLSNFTAQCLIEEAKSRIAFFEKISNFNH